MESKRRTAWRCSSILRQLCWLILEVTMSTNTASNPLSSINQQILDGFSTQHNLWARALISTDEYCNYIEVNENKFSEELYFGHIQQTLDLLPNIPNYQRLFAIHSRIRQNLIKDLTLRIDNAENSM